MKTTLNVFLRYSGIQSFIYTISSKEFKGLGQVFYLNIAWAYSGQLLALLGRPVPTIYTGGGHAYILLPNTPETIKQIEEAKKYNHWLIEGNTLYSYSMPGMFSQWFVNKSEDKAYQNIFRQLSGSCLWLKCTGIMLEIRMLNNLKTTNRRAERISICGSVDNLVQDNEYQNVCALRTLQKYQDDYKRHNFITSQSRTQAG